MRFARIYLRAVGAMSLLFGVIYVFSPTIMTGPTGFGEISAAGLTDVRATYGGFQIGLGAFLLWAASDASRIRGGLVLVLLSIGAVAASRAFGLIVDGDANAFHIGGLATEITLTLVTLFALGRLRDHGVAGTTDT